MATNIQVNANTQQAVGAFNALAAAIAQSNSQINNLNITVRDGTSTNSKYAVATDIVGKAFGVMTSLASKAATGLGFVSSTIQLVFGTVFKEMDKLQGFNAMMMVSSSSAEEAGQSYKFLRETADKLGVQFDALSNNYAKLVAALPESTEKFDLARRVFLGIAEAARTLHATNQDTQLMFYAITQMASKGVVSLEELRRQLGEKLPGTFQIAARAVNTTVPQLVAAISKGSVDSAKFLGFFGDELIRTFTEPAEKASTSISAALNRLKNVWVDFVKSILDTGAGQQIIGIFDALREKLADPYVIEKFSQLIGEVGAKIVSFIQSLTAEDLRNGFDSFAKFVQMVVDVIGKLIAGVTWIIDHAPTAGAILGGLAGASFGARAGPWGALIGGAVGGLGGFAAGQALQPDPGDQQFANLYAQQQKEESDRKAAELRTEKIQAFINIKTSPEVDKEFLKYFNVSTITTTQLEDLTKILSSTDTFKTDKAKISGIDNYAKYHIVMGPDSTGLKDVLNGKQKPSAEERSLDATYNKSIGLNPDFDKQLANLDILLKSGRLSVDQYNQAFAELVAKQPLEIELLKEAQKAEDLYNKEMQETIDQAFAQVHVKEEIKNLLADESVAANMRADDLRVETELIQIRNKAATVGLELDEKAIRLAIEKKNRDAELTQIGDGILKQTVDKYDQPIKQQQAMDKLTKDPTSGFTKKDQTDFTVSNDKNMEGSAQWMDAQKKQLDDYYAYVDGLRNTDVINEQTAQQAKAQAGLAYNEAKVNQTTEVFGTLAQLSKSGNKRLAMIGKEAAIVEATIQGYLAIQRAIAAPPGWPYNAANVIAVGVLQAANVASIVSQTGFMTGGYTGNGSTTEEAGVVHGQEFVVNASATAKNRALLEAMNRGDTVSSGSGGRSSSASSGGLKIEVRNLGTPQNYRVEALSASEARLIAEDVVEQKAATTVARDLYNPNGPMAKSVRNNTLTARRRKS